MYMCNTVLQMQHFVGCWLEHHLVHVFMYIYDSISHMGLPSGIYDDSHKFLCYILIFHGTQDM
jgi:hypothetical protein